MPVAFQWPSAQSWPCEKRHRFSYQATVSLSGSAHRAASDALISEMTIPLVPGRRQSAPGDDPGDSSPRAQTGFNRCPDNADEGILASTATTS